ncbi:MAG: hypothetical protein NZ561_06860 [Phycisphaerae bacterium]|nr:hypothetical protein [Phycisphaerae bacterium]MDW8261300.1 hypothetical protein [Phycisphaerales bacterium]
MRSDGLTLSPPGSRPTETARRRLPRFVGIGLLLALLAGVRLIWANDLPEWDIATYTLIANELLRGQSLYEDIWDIKPPAVFYTYALAQQWVGGPPASLVLLSILAAGGTLAALGLIASRAAESGFLARSNNGGAWKEPVVGRAVERSAGDHLACDGASGVLERPVLWSVLFFSVLCFEPLTAANLPNTEAFINLFLALSWAMWMQVGTSRRWWLLAAVAGALAAWASMYKQVAIAPALLLAAAHVISPPTGLPRRTAGKQAGVFLALIALAWGLLFGWFAITGRGELFWQTIVVYPRYYAGGILANLLQSLQPESFRYAPIRLLAPVVPLALIGMLVAGERVRWMLLGMCLGVHLAVALPGQFLAHYYQLWYPPLSIAAGCGAASLVAMMQRRGRRWLGVVVVGLALVAMLAPQVPWYRLPAEHWADRRYGQLFREARSDMETWFSRLGSPSPLYIWGDEPWLYLIARKPCIYPGLWKMHCVAGPLADRLTQATLDRLQEQPPGLIVVWVELGPTDHAIARWIGEHYQMVPGTPIYPLQFYVPRGSNPTNQLAPERSAIEPAPVRWHDRCTDQSAAGASNRPICSGDRESSVGNDPA